MQVIYRLDHKEMLEVRFECEFISHRQYFDVSMEDMMRHQFISRYSRMDMFWIHCRFQDLDCGSLCVDPDRYSKKEFRIERNHCNIEPLQDLIDIARCWFVKQPQYRLQLDFMNQIYQKWFDPCGGPDRFFNLSHQKAVEYKNKKVELCIKHQDLIEQYLQNKKPMLNSAKLCQAFQEVFYNGPHLDVGFEHMLWIYENYVKK